MIAIYICICVLFPCKLHILSVFVGPSPNPTNICYANWCSMLNYFWRIIEVHSPIVWQHGWLLSGSCRFCAIYVSYSRKHGVHLWFTSISVQLGDGFRRNVVLVHHIFVSIVFIWMIVAFLGKYMHSPRVRKQGMNSLFI